MTEIKKLWTDRLPPFPEEDILRIEGGAKAEYFEICACFWLFRYLHRFEQPTAVLMGDYCFGRFSRHLAAIDSVELTNAFSAFLKKDTIEPGDLNSYISFIETT